MADDEAPKEPVKDSTQKSQKSDKQASKKVRTTDEM
jgi:hypothetical protein